MQPLRECNSYVSICIYTNTYVSVIRVQQVLGNFIYVLSFNLILITSEEIIVIPVLYMSKLCLREV